MKRSFLNYVVMAAVVAVLFMAVCLVIDLIFGKVASESLSERLVQGVLFGIALSAYYFIEDTFFKKKKN